MKPKIIVGNCIDKLKELPSGSVHCCVTSPPYWGLRDYGEDDQLGLEETPDAYVENMVQVFREVRRVLRDDGTLWLNLGDSYAGGSSGGTKTQGNPEFNKNRPSREATKIPPKAKPKNLKQKDLVGIPWRVAFALQADGWYLRQDIIWHKPNPMPESVTDRCTKAHEYIFLLSKSKKYYYDHEAIKEDATYAGQSRGGSTNRYEQNEAGMDNKEYNKRNRRSVWSVCPKPFRGAHFATFPPDLIEPCVLAGCPEGGILLDPFLGSGTTLTVGLKHGRNGIGIELNPEYAKLAEKRIEDNQSLFTV